LLRVARAEAASPWQFLTRCLRWLSKPSGEGIKERWQDF
jgi:hypothetical protein